jgi:hypothetical protein
MIHFLEALNYIFNKSLMYILMMISIGSSAQYLNRDAKAIIEVSENEGVYEVTAKAENLSQIKISLSYELKVFKENLKSGNKSDNTQKGRFVIDPLNIKKLAFTSINIQDKNDKIILLLLLRNTDDEIIGKSRKVIADNKVIIENNKFILKKESNDGIKISGMVLEKIKTKPGRDFYNFFYSLFLSYNFTDTRSILIEEVFSRGRNTKIKIKIDNTIVYEFFVQPKADYLKTNAEIAIKQVYNFFRKKTSDYIVRY